MDIVAVGSVEDGAEIVLSSEADGAQIYEGDRFYVYGVTEDADPQAFVEGANGAEIDKTKAVMVLSYAPVHDGGDAAWIEALNTVAAGKDTVVEQMRRRHFPMWLPMAAFPVQRVQLSLFISPMSRPAICRQRMQQLW